MSSMSFSSFEQLFQRIGPLTDIVNCEVFSNLHGTEKFIKEKFVR